MPCRLPAVSGHIRGVRLATHSSTSGAHRGVAACSEPQVMRLGFRCDESVYIDITRYFFMTTTY